jgi:hypothetical protein
MFYIDESLKYIWFILPFIFFVVILFPFHRIAKIPDKRVTHENNNLRCSKNEYCNNNIDRKGSVNNVSVTKSCREAIDSGRISFPCKVDLSNVIYVLLFLRSIQNI